METTPTFSSTKNYHYNTNCSFYPIPPTLNCSQLRRVLLSAAKQVAVSPFGCLCVLVMLCLTLKTTNGYSGYNRTITPTDRACVCVSLTWHPLLLRFHRHHHLMTP